MLFIRDLSNLHEDRHTIVIDVQLVLRYLDSLKSSLMDDATANLQESKWDPGFRQFTLEVGGLKQPIVDLRSTILKLVVEQTKREG